MFSISRRRLRALSLAALILSATGCNSRTEPASAQRGAPSASEFEAGRAFDHLKKLVEVGPRPSGSPAIKKTQEYVSSELSSYGLKVVEDGFSGQTPRGPIPMKNIIGELTGNRPEVVLIAGHYDTKAMDGFVGANDGGSSTAAVLEMARVLSKTRPEYTIWFTFFDGEEAVVDWSANDGTDNTYGSRHLASKLAADGTLSKISAVVLVDMIGDTDLDIKRDLVSTPWLVDLMWATSRNLGHGRFFLGNETAIEDDHVPFRERGIPAIDIIDFNYGPNNSYWHTRRDTLDKVSGESMKIVGDVILASLPELFKQIGEKRPAGASR